MTAGVLTGEPRTDLPTGSLLASASGAADVGDRALALSRSSRRVEQRTTERLLAAQQAAYERRMAQQAASATAGWRPRRRRDKHKLWTTAPLNLWTSPDADATKVGEVEAGKQVLVTGRKVGGPRRDRARGPVALGHRRLPQRREALAAAAGLSVAPCPDTSVESGLTSNAVLVYRSVCHAFPQITSYGGWDNHGEHSSGRALDIMTSDVALGTAIAEFLRAHASELHLYDILWRQHIWTPGPRRRGLAHLPEPWFGDGQPLRPRARLDVLTHRPEWPA